jgi:hypothetical protein
LRPRANADNQLDDFAGGTDLREDELLAHVAAGTDIWTALAAGSEEETPTNYGRLATLVLAVRVLGAQFA